MSTVTEAQVEAAAQAIFESDHEDGPWVDAPIHWKEKSRNEARAALTAAAQVGEHLSPHIYVPSAAHMGDCAVCGHVQNAAIHEERPAPVPLGRAGATAILTEGYLEQGEREKLSRADDGWALVPTVLTEKMVAAAKDCFEQPPSYDLLSCIWGRSLAAAPSPPVQSGKGAAQHIEVDIGAAIKLLEASPELGQKLNELVLGKEVADQLSEAHDRIATITQALAEADKLIEPFAKLIEQFDADIADGGTRSWIDFLIDVAWPSENECRAAGAWRERYRKGEGK